MSNTHVVTVAAVVVAALVPVALCQLQQMGIIPVIVNGEMRNYFSTLHVLRHNGLHEMVH